MTPDEARQEAVRYWCELADEALASARSELAAGRLGFALNRGYYACFYAASAVFLQEGRTFRKHAGVRTAVHAHLVKPGRISADLGQWYDRLFDQRLQADYTAMVQFDKSTVREAVEQAGQFVDYMRRLLGSQAG